MIGEEMLKIAIVGCGNIADSHASQIRRIPGCELAAVCDREELMAEQLQERFGVRHAFTNVEDLITKARPDVVHIATSPQSHFEIARQCLSHGCHVYVEKPFTLYADEAVKLIALAEERGLKLTAGHDALFSHAAMAMRRTIRSGYLGGAPIHMESTWGYALSDPAYAKAMLGNKQHWVRQLPGGLLQNIISHGVSRIAEYFPGDNPRVIAHAFVSPFLRGLGEKEILDELRVIITDGERTTAYFTFSSQMRPCAHEFRIYGPANGLVLDESQQTLIRLRGTKFKSYADKFLPQLVFARQYAANAARNMRLFLARNFHGESSKKHLMEAFYRSIAERTPPPIPYREIALTARVMDAIFEQVRPGESFRDVPPADRTRGRFRSGGSRGRDHENDCFGGLCRGALGAGSHLEPGGSRVFGGGVWPQRTTLRAAPQPL
jgi:predicted dehydrogenase